MKFGNIEIGHGICLAPMAGVSDYAFRLLCRRYGAEYAVSEMVSAKALCYEQICRRSETKVPSRTAPLCAVKADELPMAVQLFGSESEFLAEAAKRLVEGNYRGNISEVPPSAIDLNMGCPMAKIVGNGEGSALLKDPKKAATLVRAVADAVEIPVTVKIRAGWDKEHINAVEVAKHLEEAGASLICIHGRTREQFYAPSADWEIIAKVKETVKIPVLGNGDIFSAEDALRMLKTTGCDGVMIGRGARGNPWIFAETLALLEGKSYTPPTLEERLSVALEHARLIACERGERLGVPEARKHMAWYLSGVRGAAEARKGVMTAGTLPEFEAVFERLKEENL
ncbi:MAG: tRNA dihydrouridine synthase DusB [Clostridia bacterium]|nr:tRNA dihydrouridine synthase DusB [Clostridia bacterium]